MPGDDGVAHQGLCAMAFMSSVAWRRSRAWRPATCSIVKSNTSAAHESRPRDHLAAQNMRGESSAIIDIIMLRAQKCKFNFYSSGYLRRVATPEMRPCREHGKEVVM